MTKIRCYLAGGFVPFGQYKDWRDYVKERVGDKMEFYDPRIDTDQSSIATFVYQDLRGVGSCDIVFDFVTGWGDVGETAEDQEGNSKGKLVVLCINDGVRLVHPFLFGISRRVFMGMETGIVYLLNLAEYGLDNEFEAIYKTKEEIEAA